MCGINGIFAYHSASSEPKETELLATREAMRARGPDGSGAWWSVARRCGLGHRRLSIIDLSDRASQPMTSDDGRFVVVFNGEIYNYPQLRTELETDGARFRTTSDTEALLHLYARHGAEMVHRLRGMFAFAIWDQARRGLFLARDPYGIKPLYTANDGWTFRFASQVKALLAGGQVSRDPEPAGVVGFHLFGSVPEPFTLYRDIRALPAGHTQWVDAAGPREPSPSANLAEVLAEGAANPTPAAELPERVRAGALDSVRAHLLSDVEVGYLPLRRCRLRCDARRYARRRATRDSRDHARLRRVHAAPLRTRRRRPRGCPRSTAHATSCAASERPGILQGTTRHPRGDGPALDRRGEYLVHRQGRQGGRPQGCTFAALAATSCLEVIQASVTCRVGGVGLDRSPRYRDSGFFSVSSSGRSPLILRSHDQRPSDFWSSPEAGLVPIFYAVAYFCRTSCLWLWTQRS